MDNEGIVIIITTMQFTIIKPLQLHFRVTWFSREVTLRADSSFADILETMK